jgi:hypothetical protein
VVVVGFSDGLLGGLRGGLVGEGEGPTFSFVLFRLLGSIDVAYEIHDLPFFT